MKFESMLEVPCCLSYDLHSQPFVVDQPRVNRDCVFNVCIFLRQYRIHMDIGNSKNYMEFKMKVVAFRTLWSCKYDSYDTNQ